MGTDKIAIIMFFTSSLLATVFILYFIYKSKKEKYDMIKHAISSNYPDAHLFLSNGYGKEQSLYISSIKKIAVAVALLIPCCFEIDTDIKIILLSVGSFLLVYGVGMFFLFCIKQERKHDEKTDIDTDMRKNVTSETAETNRDTGTPDAAEHVSAE